MQIAIVLISSLSFSQISDTWYWNYGDNKHSFKLDIELTDTNLKGFHCSTFHDGKKIDCIENTSDSDDHSIDLTEVSSNVYEGTIKSGYSNTIGTVRLTYLAATDEVVFEIIEDPIGEFYLPNNIRLNKTP